MLVSCGGNAGPTGPAGADGKDGVDGKDGATWLSGTAMPTTKLDAKVGDFYFDEDDGDIYRLGQNGWVYCSGY